MSYRQKFWKTKVEEWTWDVKFVQTPSQKRDRPLTDTLFSRIQTFTTDKGPPTLAMSIAGSK